MLATLSNDPQSNKCTRTGLWWDGESLSLPEEVWQAQQSILMAFIHYCLYFLQFYVTWPCNCVANEIQKGRIQMLAYNGQMDAFFCICFLMWKTILLLFMAEQGNLRFVSLAANSATARSQEASIRESGRVSLLSALARGFLGTMEGACHGSPAGLLSDASCEPEPAFLCTPPSGERPWATPAPPL